jgi:SAM-dependent methyltransferase
VTGRWAGIRGRLSRAGEGPSPDATTTASPTIPFPPPEMRALVGPTDEASFDNPTGALVYPYLVPEQYRRVFDFGCGCGRVARQLVLQSPRPERYLGVDLHRGMIEWARANLTPVAPEFEFLHHNVYNRSFNPAEGLPDVAPFPADDSSFTLVNALSVFTHLTERQAIHYIGEAARILEPGGLIHASFFLIDKKQFPMMMEYSNALYLSYEDPSAAVLDDREWVCRIAAEAGLTLAGVVPPRVRNHQWVLMFARSRPGLEPVPFPEDEAPVEAVVTPPMPVDAHLIGLSGQSGR